MAKAVPLLEIRLVILASLALTCLPEPVLAQAGDKAGEDQPAIDKAFDVPPAPVLNPEQALASFKLQPGYRIECAASDPLINDPVDISWDAKGRMWVVEMTGFMPDPDGHGELNPVCAIAILTDTDQDGVFDQREEFLHDLVLPRSICHVPGGVLVLAPPQLRFYAHYQNEHFEVVDDGFDAALKNPEHAANAMTLGLDNWVYLANHNRRYRHTAAGWLIEKVPQTGQWGLGEDDWGRRCYNYNSTPVRGDLLPTHYLLRNPNLGRAKGSNVPIATQTRVWPSRLNTGVNRGYRQETLRDDGFLARYTAACGPDFFRGTLLQAADRGDIFVAEPAANLVRHLRIDEDQARLRGENAYASLEQEFLSSSDERFRPVNLRNGPDGALYVVDLYRGILQHRVFMTSFLRRQVEERNLHLPIGLGRIWRIVYEGSTNKEVDVNNLRELSSRNLVAQLYEPNAWNRRQAQRLLIEEVLSVAAAPGREAVQAGDAQHEIDLLLERASENPNTPLTRSHALWTLEGRGGLRAEFLALRLAKESHPKVLAQLIRLSEDFSEQALIWRQWTALLQRPEKEVRWQLACSIGQNPNPGAMALLAELLSLDPTDQVLRQCALSGLHNREADFFQRISRTETLLINTKDHRTLVRAVGRCVARGANYIQLDHAWARCHRFRHSWIAQEFLRGMLAGLPKKSGDKRYRFQQRRPDALLSLMTAENLALGELAQTVASRFQWNFNPEATELNKLPDGLRKSIARGKSVYALSCGPCHQNDGLGLAGLAPPLDGSEWLNQTDAELATIALFGLSGEISVKGQTWNLTMPGWAHLNDKQIADALNFVLHQWGPEARQVAAATVAEARKQ